MVNPGPAMLRGRKVAEQMMVDECTITRAGTETTDPLTGQVTSTPTTVYFGRCRVMQNAGNAAGRDVGEAYLMQLPFEVHVPVVGTTGIRVGDRVTVTTATHDDDLQGRQFIVMALAHKTHMTARRLGVQEATS